MRLLEFLVIRRQWQTQVALVQQMHGWVRAAEHILAGQWGEPGANLTNTQVAERFDTWRQGLTHQQEGSDFNEEPQRALAHFLKVTTHLRPWLIRFYDVEGLPRTDNALEDTIRAIKQRHRRISGRKSWNRYLLRYGRYVAFFEGLARGGAERYKAERMLRGVGRAAWQAGRSALHQSRREQVNKYRFRRQREQYLCSLEHRWGQTTTRSSDLP